MGHGTCDLIEALTRKEGAMEELVQLLAEEQRSIIELDLASLEIQVDKKKEAFARLERAASHCRQLMTQLAAELGLPEADRLSLLIPKVAPPQREELRGLQGKLLGLGNLLERVEADNGSLLQGALVTVNRSLEFFGRAFNRSTTYGEAGQMLGGGPRASIVCREA